MAKGTGLVRINSTNRVDFKPVKIDIGNDRSYANVQSSKKDISSIRKFGKPGDYIELNIYNSDSGLISHIRDFKDYTLPEESKTPDNFYNEIIVDPNVTLQKLNLNNGDFELEYR